MGGNHRIGNEPNRGTANLWCGLYHQDGTRFRCNGEGLDQVVLDDDGCRRLRRVCGARSASSTTVRSSASSSTRRDGCRADLVITDEGERSFANAKTFSGAVGGDRHDLLQQLPRGLPCQRARWSSTVGGSEVVDAPAWRDHSWGVRRWDSFVSSRSFGGSHGAGDDALHFRFASMVGSNGSFFRIGALTRGGQKIPVADAAMLVHVDDDSMSCPSAEVRYELEDGGTTVVRIDTIGGMIGVTAQRHGWESVGDVTVDGVPGGWGFLETTLERPQRVGAARVRAR